MITEIRVIGNNDKLPDNKCWHTILSSSLIIFLLFLHQLDFCWLKMTIIAKIVKSC